MPTQLDQLIAVLKHAPDEIFIQTHDVPDPDAIGAAFGLQYLLNQNGISAQIVYNHEIEKADTAKMIEIFSIPIHHYSRITTLGAEDWTVLIDAQKGNSNVLDLPTDEVACIDHHEHKQDVHYQFEDIRSELGACSTIIADYFFENKIEPPPIVATALLYGIFVDTDNLSRGVSNLDVEMFYRLYTLAEKNKLTTLRGSQITKKDLLLYAEAFRNVETYDCLAFLKIQDTNDSLIGAANDFVLSIDTVNVSIAYSQKKDGIKLSIRSTIPHIKANELIRFITANIGVGGGHAHMAGGFIPDNRIPPDKNIDLYIRYKAIRYLEGIIL
ncbi:MAG TPA: DHH family phosphoesterase [Spirochaetia bacterium]|nr:DHH family phosphoesterase [Spirochaetales bacterium]HQK34723.1 DHH family phosphoesterase [Spirochaetales bacterium]HRS64698.1 DHH family phosphoesterase [Spirochaetia bacterium]HRV28765.1 DHH family phosphoesterase [Spirochaetia bacterium]